MQPPVDPNPSLQDSVVGGDLHTGHVIHNHYHMPQPPQPPQPQVVMQQPAPQYQQQPPQYRQPADYYPTGPKKDVLVAYLLWFFLGPLGAHRFYFNHIGVGLFYFFTFGGCGLLWMIDAILIPDIVRRENMGHM